MTALSPTAKLAIATQRLNRLTDDLEAIADWRDELRSKLFLASLRFELVGLDEEEQDALTREVSAFLQVCSALSDAGGADMERRAA